MGEVEDVEGQMIRIGRTASNLCRDAEEGSRWRRFGFLPTFGIFKEAGYRGANRGSLGHVVD